MKSRVSAAPQPSLRWLNRHRIHPPNNPAMFAYLPLSFLYAIPILIVGNLITFALFFIVNTPDDMARTQLGVKRLTPEAIGQWKVECDHDQPLFANTSTIDAIQAQDFAVVRPLVFIGSVLYIAGLILTLE
jgi:ABC-type dipeptide/oligopeptide/nickel transport system permease component